MPRHRPGRSADRSPARLRVRPAAHAGGPSFGFAAGEPVRGHPVGAESGSHVGARQCGELPNGANPHPPQQIRQLFPARTGQARLGGKLPDRQHRQKLRVTSRLDDTARTRSEDRGGQLVGDPDLTLGAGRGHRIDQPLGGLLPRTRNSGPPRAPATPGARAAAPRRGAPGRPPPRSPLRRSGRRGRRRRSRRAVAGNGPPPPGAAALAALPPHGRPTSRRSPGWPE